MSELATAYLRNCCDRSPTEANTNTGTRQKNCRFNCTVIKVITLKDARRSLEGSKLLNKLTESMPWYFHLKTGCLSTILTDLRQRKE